MREEINVEKCYINRRGHEVFLDFIVSCPKYYKFVKLNIIGYFLDQNGHLNRSVPIDYEPETDDKEWFAGICLSEDAGHINHGFYRVKFTAVFDNQYSEYADFADDFVGQDIFAEAYVSDVEFMYDCLSNEILHLDTTCGGIPDSVL
jgi:hypothetical protein